MLFEQLNGERTWYADELGFASGVADQIAQAYIDAERAQALADLRRTAVELMRLQDEERRRIGRDLHDSTGQTLAALEISLARLAKTPPAAPGRAELLRAVCAAREPMLGRDSYRVVSPASATAR